MIRAKETIETCRLDFIETKTQRTRCFSPAGLKLVNMTTARGRRFESSVLIFRPFVLWYSLSTTGNPIFSNRIFRMTLVHIAVIAGIDGKANAPIPTVIADFTCFPCSLMLRQWNRINSNYDSKTFPKIYLFLQIFREAATHSPTIGAAPAYENVKHWFEKSEGLEIGFISWKIKIIEIFETTIERVTLSIQFSYYE